MSQLSSAPFRRAPRRQRQRRSGDPAQVVVVPSGKHGKNYGKLRFFMGKSTISMAIFNSKLFVYQRDRDVTGIKGLVEGKIFRRRVLDPPPTTVSCRFYKQFWENIVAYQVSHGVKGTRWSCILRDNVIIGVN